MMICPLKPPVGLFFAVMVGMGRWEKGNRVRRKTDWELDDGHKVVWYEIIIDNHG